MVGADSVGFTYLKNKIQLELWDNTTSHLVRRNQSLL